MRTEFLLLACNRDIGLDDCLQFSLFDPKVVSGLDDVDCCSMIVTFAIPKFIVWLASVDGGSQQLAPGPLNRCISRKGCQTEGRSWCARTEDVSIRSLTCCIFVGKFERSRMEVG
jgi:hypothetical protein